MVVQYNTKIADKFVQKAPSPVVIAPHLSNRDQHNNRWNENEQYHRGYRIDTGKRRYQQVQLALKELSQQHRNRRRQYYQERQQRQIEQIKEA